jgi:hypothetical protein
MRLLWVIVVGVATVACKDKPANERPSAATPGSATATPATPPSRGEAPTLPADRSFDDITREAAWAASAEQQLHAVAPELGGVSCKQLQCEGTLTARTDRDLMVAMEKLQDDEALRAIDGFKSLKLTVPEQRDDHMEVKIVVRFARQ